MYFELQNFIILEHKKSFCDIKEISQKKSFETWGTIAAYEANWKFSEISVSSISAGFILNILFLHL